jgi:AraC-like DNA-binding protein
MLPRTTTKSKTASSSFLYPVPDVNWRMGAVGDFEADESFVELYFVLDGKATYQPGGLGELSLSAGQYNMIYPPLLQTPAWPAREQNNVTTFTIHFPIPYLQNLVVSFPALSFFLDKVQQGITCKLSKSPGIADPKMITLIRNIQDCSYAESLKKTYLDLQISTLLAIALIRMVARTSRNKPEILLKPQDIEKIQATREYLLQNMEQPPTLIELAHKMGLNDFKLKKGYKQLYGMTLFDDFLHARMEKARRLMMETKQSIVAIAELAGYKNVSNFSVAFKRYFGHTPGWLRKIDRTLPPS